MKSTTTGLSILFILAGALMAAAQGAPEFADWAEGPEGFLLTDSEREAWSVIAEDAAAEEFIGLFWARRDPDLSTRENEFQTEFDRRIAVADAEFGIEGERGALTDRGRTFLLLGMPSEHARIPIGDYLAQLYRTGKAPEGRSSDPEAHIQMYGVTFSLHKGEADMWGYQRGDLPDGIEWPEKTEIVTFAFFDHDGTGHFRTQLGIRKAPGAAAVLVAAPAALVRHPDLAAMPVYGLIPGVEAARADELAWLDADVETEGVVASIESGIGGFGPVTPWLSVRVPEASPGPRLLVGRLDAGGVTVGSFRKTVEPVVGALGSTYELAVHAPVGEAVLELALVEDGAPVHVERLDIHVEEVGEGFLTVVFAGAEVLRDEAAVVGQPFVFGGYHLVSRPDGRYRTGENLALFCILTVPEGAAEPRSGSVAMRWYVDGKPTPKQPASPAQFQPGGDGQWVWGTQLPLEGLARDHEYELKITVVDSLSAASRTTKIPVIFIDE